MTVMETYTCWSSPGQIAASLEAGDEVAVQHGGEWHLVDSVDLGIHGAPDVIFLKAGATTITSVRPRWYTMITEPGMTPAEREALVDREERRYERDHD